MTSRFQQFVISDSDEDSADMAVQQHRDGRANGSTLIQKMGSTSAHPSQVPKQTASSMSFHTASSETPLQPIAQGGEYPTESVPSQRHTPRESVHETMSVRSSHLNATSRRSEQQPQVSSSRGANMADHASVSPASLHPNAMAAEYPVEDGIADGEHQLPATVRPPVSAPPVSTRSAQSLAMPPSSHASNAQQQRRSNGGTPRPSALESNTANTLRASELGSEVERRSVPQSGGVVRGTSGYGEASQSPQQFPTILAARIDSSVSRPGVTQRLPPPRRVSPQAQRAAVSRSVSRRHITPRSGHDEEMDEVPPQIPTRAYRQQAPSAQGDYSIEENDQQKAHTQHSLRDSARQSSHATEEENHALVPHSVGAHVDNTATESIDFRMDGTSVSHTLTITTREVSRSVPMSTCRARPIIPSPSALEPLPTPYSIDDDGNMVAHHRAAVRQTVLEDGRVAWVFVPPHRENDADGLEMHEIAAPPKRLSQRAQDIMAAKRRAVEEEARRRHAEQLQLQQQQKAIEEKQAVKRQKEATHGQSIHRQSGTLYKCTFPVEAFAGEHSAAQHRAPEHEAGCEGWSAQHMDQHPSYVHAREAAAVHQDEARWRAEQLVRIIQPIQVDGSGFKQVCACASYDSTRSAALSELISSHHAMEEGFKRYLNLQPMQLANVAVEDMAEGELMTPSSRNRHPSVHDVDFTAGPRGSSLPRGIATLGGLWCTVQALREDGRPAARSAAQRRVMRVCGGQAIGLPLREHHRTLDVRCYELILFSQEATAPTAVNYGSNNITLGQLVPPQASSFPLTPRVIDTPAMLKEYKKKLLTTKCSEAIIENNEDDNTTFAGRTYETGATPARYITLTLVTINTHQKYTVDLTLVLLPFCSDNTSGGKTLAEIPRFSPTSVAANRRLQSVSLSFSTKSSFMSAYKALLWAAECNIVDIEQPRTDPSNYVKLRVTATTSPLLPWSSSLGAADESTPKNETFRGHCVDYAVVAHGTSPNPREPLRLDDFVIHEVAKAADSGAVGEEDALRQSPSSRQQQRRRSSIFTNTLVTPSAREQDVLLGEGAGGTTASANTNNDTVVALTAFGVVRRAVNQKTGEVFDVRVLPRSRTRMLPWFSQKNAADRGGKMQEEHVWEEDVEAAIMMEYVSQLPFLARVYGVLVDEQRYYVFQEPWMSAVALEQSPVGSVERASIEFNPMLKRISESTTVMSLKDFIHGVLHAPAQSRLHVAKEEARIQIAHLLASQLLLLLASVHGKGMLLGPCPPQRILVRIESDAAATAVCMEDEDLVSEDCQSPQRENPAKTPVESGRLQLFIPDIGINTTSWSYERQQCGILEYLSPSFIFEHMLDEDVGRESRPWTVHDDYWTYLCVCFELFAADGTALVKASAGAPTPLPMLTKFTSPVDILDLWREVVTDDRISRCGTAHATLAARVRGYVRRRLLESVAPSLDGWITTKAEEMEYFGTTATRRKSARAVPREGDESGMIGVSLSSMHPRLARNEATTEMSSVLFFDEDEEGGRSVGRSVRSNSAVRQNILEEMPWILSYRDLFDSILDVVFLDNNAVKCAIHGPSLFLFSHSFFGSLDLAQVFDGSYSLPPAASAFCRRYLSKSKVREALMMYRSRAHRGPVAKRADAPLMITSSAFNTGGGSGGPAALLLLSAREGGFGDDASHFDEDLLASGGVSPSSAARGLSPRARSESPAVQQNKLRTMYKGEELQEIADLENDVRGALHAHQTRDNSCTPRTSTTHGSSTRHHDGHSGVAPSAGSVRSSRDSHRHQRATAPSIDELRDDRRSERTSGGSSRRHHDQRRADPNVNSYGKLDTRQYIEQRPRSHQASDYKDVGRDSGIASESHYGDSNYDSTVNTHGRGSQHAQRYRNSEKPRSQHSGGISRGGRGTHTESSRYDDGHTARSSREGQRAHPRSSNESSGDARINKGSQHRSSSNLADPMISSFDRPVIDQTISEARSRARHQRTSRDPGVVHAAEPGCQDSDDESVVLVASDNEHSDCGDAEARSAASTYNSNKMQRRHVTSRNKDKMPKSAGSHTPMSRHTHSTAASDAYFEF